MVKMPSLKEMMKAGLHFGHKSSKWNPKVKPYIYTIRNGVHIFDLEKTQKTMEKALQEVAETASKGGVVLFVGTKKQGRDIVKKYAIEAGMPYVTESWIGGTVTNFAEINKLVKKLDQMEEAEKKDDYEKKYTKWERVQFGVEMDKLRLAIGGIRAMDKLPDLIYIIGVKDEKTAVREAQKKGIRTVGVVDSNADPESVDFPIIANDDAVKSIEMVTKLVAEAVAEGKKEAVSANDEVGKKI